MQIPNMLQGFGLEIILIAEIGYLWIRSLKNRKTETLAAFFRLCTALMLFLLINIPVRISDLDLVRMNPDAVFILNAFFIFFETLTAYEWLMYFLTVQGSNPHENTTKRVLFLIPLAAVTVLLIASYRTHWLFYVDENGLYQRGSLFFLQFVCPYSYLAASFINAVRDYKKNKNKRLFTIFASALITSLIASVLQILFSGSFVHAGLSLAVTLVYIEMYQYEIKQIDKMKSLEVVNRQLEIVNDKLNDTVRELQLSVANERAANNAKNEFLSMMSHDIRTPLNGILGIIEINERHPEDTALQSANRKKARIAANHLVSLINDILDMSKLSSGKYELSREPFVITELVNEVLTIEHSYSEQYCVTLFNESGSDTFRYPETYGSPLHIKRILLNIIGNAVKYNKKDGFVKIGIGHESAGEGRITYSLTVSDSGIGMSEEYIKKLFEPFSQEHIDARSVYEGSGLGMSITKALVDTMGGTISVKSKINEGTTFVVRLTFDIAQEDKNSASDAAYAENLNGVRILLVDDNELNTDIAQMLLEESGAAVETAGNGQIALEKFTDNPAGTFDLILMDCMMPVMDGFDATKAIRSTDKSDAKKIPIIAMTANAFTDDVKKCLDAGMNDHLAKPFDIARVIVTVRKFVPASQNRGGASGLAENS